MKVLIKLIDQMKYTDTAHIEWICVLVSLFYIPEVLTECAVQESIGKYWFIAAAIIGIIGLTKNSIRWRYLHVQCLLICNLIPLSTIVIRNLYHPIHLKLFTFQALLSIFLIWRLGTEKMYRASHPENNHG